MSALRKAKQLSAINQLRRWDDQAYRCQNHCRGWIANIDRHWKVGGYIQLPRNPVKLPHHNLHQLTLDI
jgi:hypothetical protein